jgi:hypothetical protein
MGEERGVDRVLVWKPEGKRQLGRPGLDERILSRWILRKWGLDWIVLAQDRHRLAGTCECGSEP